jgi:ubiquinone/menaquinone biosynthesis C-methylase UbiE
MDSPDEVDSYSSASTERHLAAIDATFVEHVLQLLLEQPLPVKNFAWALDVGCGPAQIPLLILRRLPRLRFVALDRFPLMLAAAQRNALQADVSDRLILARADAHRLPFPDHSFSLVISNSVLHHVRSPAEFLREIFRVASPDGAVLIRDLRRPSRPLLGWHLWRHGRRYSGSMRCLFDASVRAAYTANELEEMLSDLEPVRARVFHYRNAHVGVERPAVAVSPPARS